MFKSGTTRGYGLLEKFLALQRLRMADSLIPPTSRTGRILDIGCGLHPFFLRNIDFKRKFALDKTVPHPSAEACNDISFTRHDIETDGRIPFESDHFDIVTMLAVFEHIEPCRLPIVIDEIHRVLRPGGRYIMTTPSLWADPLLKVMAKLKLVSSVELDEHKAAYSPAKIGLLLEKTRFEKEKVRYGYFEIYLNIWMVAEK